LVTMKDLLESGAHFGHKVSRWNPKMKEYIFGEKNGIYIIDLQKTVKMLEKAYEEIVEQISNGKSIMFVGTKRQSKDIIREEATRCGAFYICERWLGGMLTNFRTIKKTIDKLLDYEEKKESGFLDTLPKKELLSIIRKMEKMESILSGVKQLKKLPDMLYVVDIKREYIAVHEANILGIPVIAITDTNTDPDKINIPIPANDDAIRSIKLVTSIISQAVLDGKQLFESRKAAEEEEEKRKEKERKLKKEEEEKAKAKPKPKSKTQPKTIAKKPKKVTKKPPKKKPPKLEPKQKPRVTKSSEKKKTTTKTKISKTKPPKTKTENKKKTK
jgi:small subunit ribosomal protein S2